MPSAAPRTSIVGLGFKPRGEPFEEAGIAHIEMARPLAAEPWPARNAISRTRPPAPRRRPIRACGCRTRHLAGRSRWRQHALPLLALMMFLAPALGVPHEEMLQDTLKSIVVSFCALGAALLFFWQQRGRREPLRWHAVMWLPLAADGLCAGQHGLVAHLPGRASRRSAGSSSACCCGWASTPCRASACPTLAWGIHAGAVVASLWAALQFWVDFQLFPARAASRLHLRQPQLLRRVRGLHPAVLRPCCWRGRGKARRLRCCRPATGLIIVAILMTGTRAALIALWLQLLVVLPLHRLAVPPAACLLRLATEHRSCWQPAFCWPRSQGWG